MSLCKSTGYSCHILIKLEYYPESFEKFANIKFHENPAIGSRVVSCDGRTDRETDMKNLAVFAILRKCLIEKVKVKFTLEQAMKAQMGT